MKDIIERRLLDLEVKLTEAQSQYDSQLSHAIELINQEKCILYMALQSPMEINSVDDIVVPEPAPIPQQ